MEEIQKSAVLTGCKMTVAGAFAFWIYHSLPWPYGYWSVVTVAAVTRPGIINTFSKIITRIIGTIIGATLAYSILLIANNSPFIIILLFFLIIILSSYIALQKSIFNYAGIVIGLTLTIVLSASLILGNLLQTMIYRMLEVLIGIICIGIVNIIIRLIFSEKEKLIKSIGTQFSDAYYQLIQYKKSKDLIIASIGIAFAASITYLPWLYWRYPGGFWATISCFFIMEETFNTVLHKSWMRFFAHIIAAAVGGFSAILIGDHTMWLLIPLLVSFFIFGYIMVSGTYLSQAGNTMGIALAIMLLASTGASSSLTIVAARFFNVIGGIAVGCLVTYLYQKIAARW